MSPASRSVKRLRDLYSSVFHRMREREARLADPLAGHVHFASMEPLEPRLLLTAAPTLPGLHLVDPNPRLDGQVVVLDFDGAEDVDYRGPVTVDGIDVPAFAAPDSLAGEEQEIIGQTLRLVRSSFASSGVLFTLDRPSEGTFSTVFIGGNGAAFSDLGNFAGLAEQVDAGNASPNDIAFVFTECIVESDASALAQRLAANISHETGHLIGYAHEQGTEDGTDLLSLAAYSGRIVSASPSTFVGGVATTVTVRVQNTGDSSDMIIEWDSAPSGWSISPKNLNPTIPYLGYLDNPFTVTAPVGGGSGTIVWKFYDDGWGVHPTGSTLLYTYNQSVSAAAAAPEMDVQGNGQSIVDGDATPSTSDHTDFGSVSVASGSVTRTFTIKNTGNAALNLTGNPRVTVSDSTNFSVVSQPNSPVVATTGSTTFEIKFDPTIVGTKTATVSIANNDSNENPYDFVIQGVGAQVNTLTWRSGSTSGSSIISSKEAGQTVYLGATATGMSGQTITVTIYEDDGIDLDDNYGNKSITFDSSGWGSASWTADWDNGDGWAPYQTYYFYYSPQNLYSTTNLVLTDVTPPFAPTGLAVSPTSGPSTTRTFSWNPTTDNPSDTLGSGFKEFVFRVDGTEKYRGTATSRDVSGLPVGDRTWLVEAWDNNGKMSSTSGPGFSVGQLNTLTWRSGSSSGSSMVSSREAGNTVYLGATSVGMANQTIQVTVYEEDDYDFDNQYDTLNITFDSSGWGYTTWTPRWERDDGMPPWEQFYFEYSPQSLQSNKMVVTDITPPTTFDLSGPDNGSQVTGSSVAFSWGGSDDAWYGSGFKSYTLQVATDSGFNNKMIDRPGLTGTTRTETISDEGTYYWRLIAYDNNDNPRYSSSTRSFQRHPALSASVFHPHIIFDLNGNGAASGSWPTDDPYFIFTPAASGTATFNHGYTDSDATMRLYRSDGAWLKTESESDGSNSMSYAVAAGMEYSLWLDTPTWMFDFSVNIDLPSPSCSPPIELDAHGDKTYWNQYIDPSSEGEYWRYTAPASGPLTVEADSVGGVGWDTDLFIFDSAGFLIYSDTGSFHDGYYTGDVTAGQVLYFLVRGDVNDEGSDSTGRYDLYITGPEVNLAPIISITAPGAGGAVVTLPADYMIGWDASDPNGTSPTVSLYYDANTSPGGETLIASELSNTGNYLWDVPSGLLGQQVYVKGVASDGSLIGVDYSDGRLTVNRPPTTPGTLTPSDITTNTARIDWVPSVDPDSDPITYEIEYGVNNTPGWTSAGTTDNTFTVLTGLQPDTVYVVHVRAADGRGGISEWNEEDPAFRTVGESDGKFMVVVPWQFEKTQDLPVVLVYRDYPDFYRPNVNYATVKIGPAGSLRTVDLYTADGINLNTGGAVGHSIEFSDGADPYYEVCNNADWWYTLGYIRWSDFDDLVASGSTTTDLTVEVDYRWKWWGLFGEDWNTPATAKVTFVGDIPSWSGDRWGWYAGDTHVHSALTDTQWADSTCDVEFGTPTAIARLMAEAMGISWITMTDHSYDLDSNPEPFGEWFQVADPDVWMTTANYASQPNKYQWAALEYNPAWAGYGLLKGEEISIGAGRDEEVDTWFPQLHLLAYGFASIDPFVVGYGVQFAALPVNVLPDTMDDIAQLDGRMFGYAAHPAEDNSIFGEPWTTDDVLSALPFVNSEGEPILRGFEFWNGNQGADSGNQRDDSFTLWEDALKSIMSSSYGPSQTNYHWFLSGGSDDHLSEYLKDKTRLGDVRTVALASSSSSADILNAFYNGQTIVTDGPLFTMGVDMNGDDDLWDFGVDAMPGDQRVVTTPSQGILRFDFPDSSDTPWRTPTVGDLKIWHYDDEGNRDSADRPGRSGDGYISPGESTWDAYADWSPSEDGTGWQCYRAELHVDEYTAYSNPIWLYFAVPNQPPSVESLSDSPDLVTRCNTLTLTANGVSDLHGAVSKVEFYRDSNGDGVLDVSTDQYLGQDSIPAGGWSWSGSTAGFSLGTNRYFARAQDNDSAWSNVVSTTGSVINAVPTAVIDQITPSPVQPPSQYVYFYGTGQDQDGNTVAREWRSDLDGLLSTSKDWNTKSDNLTVGQHQISFRVKDNDGQWSNWATGTLTVQNALPAAQMGGVPGGGVAPGSTVALTLGGHDNDENGQSIVGGRLLLNGNETATPLGSYLLTAPTNPGWYTLSYSVQDDEGTWSDPVTALLNVQPAAQATVVGRHIFYNNSYYDGQAANAAAEIAAAASAPVVDGLEDAVWTSVASHPIDRVVYGVRNDTADSSGEFKATWDESALYLFARVKDDIRVNDSPIVWDDDALEVYLDPNHSRASAFDGIDDVQYLFRWGDGMVHVSPSSAELTAGMTFATQPQGDGYLVEVSIPWSTLGVSPRPGTLLGLDVAILDDDDGGYVDSKVQWFGTQNRAHLDPSTWATVVLAGDPAVESSPDDAAIATDKEALMPDETGSGTNITAYSKGINGIMVDIDDLGNPGGLNLGTIGNYLGFKVGTSGDPSGWPAAPAPQAVSVRAGAGAGGSDRVTIIWKDNNLDGVVDPNEAVAKQWLQVTVKAGAATGLGADDVFYFGNLPGDANGDGTVDAVDYIAMKQAFGSSVTKPGGSVDFDCSGTVDYGDLMAVMGSFGQRCITPQGPRIVAHWPDGLIGASVDYVEVMFNEPIAPATFTAEDVTVMLPQPSELGYYNSPGTACGVQVVGTLAYVVDGSAGLRVIDVSNPAAPFERGFYDTPGYAMGVQVVGALAYVADCSAGLRVIDVSNPAAPFERGFYDTPGNAIDVQVVGSLAYVVDGHSLRIIDVSNPAAPAEVGYYETPDWANGVQVVGTLAYVADGFSGLRIIDVSAPAAPFERGYYDTPGYAYGIQVVGTLAYVADGSDGGLRIIDVSNPAAPFERGYYDTPSWSDGVQVVGTLAYVADGYSMWIIDVSNPAAPVQRGYYVTPGWAWDVQVVGALAYVAEGSYGLRIIQVGQPAQGVSQIDATTYRVQFAAPLADGSYQVFVGPNIADLAGNTMDQDADGISGQMPDDVYSFGFTVEATSPSAAGLSVQGAALVSPVFLPESFDKLIGTSSVTTEDDTAQDVESAMPSALVDTIAAVPANPASPVVAIADLPVGLPAASFTLQATAGILDALAHSGPRRLSATPSIAQPSSTKLPTLLAVHVGPLPTFPSPLLSPGRAGPVVADVLQLAAPWWSGNSARREAPDEPWMTRLAVDIAGKPRKGRLNPIGLDLLAARR